MSGFSYFVSVPPIDIVMPVFEALTGKSMEVGVIWGSWNSLTEEIVVLVRGYFRPCHRKAMMEALAGDQKATLTFLRQLVRPHGLKISARGSMWSLDEQVAESKGKGITVQQGVRIEWT